MTAEDDARKSKPKILIVDDEEPIHALIKRVLGGYVLRSAFDGAEAVRLAAEERPDLILLDVHMPKKDGREVLQELRRDVRTQMTPVIFLTSDGALLDKTVGFQLGADDYVTKPFRAEELALRVRSILRRSAKDLSANPLTRLPGSPSIEDEVNRRLLAGRPFAFIYADIDNFKAFNDVYGYARGDQVIQETAAVLLESLALAGADGFLGHIGGDDFVIISPSVAAMELAKDAASRFDSRAPSHYSPEDRARGGIASLDRSGTPREFPLMSLSIAVTTTENTGGGPYARFVDAVQKIKKHLKSSKDRKGSAYLLDRRKP